MKHEEFKADRKTINAVVRSIEVIGEASKKIPTTVTARYPGVPWKKMAGMKDKLIHEYFGIDLEILWKVADEGGASYILSGSLMKAGEKIVINITLQKPQTSEVISPISVECTGL
jgi:hypothetical protein